MPFSQLLTLQPYATDLEDSGDTHKLLPSVLITPKPMRRRILIKQGCIPHLLQPPRLPLVLYHNHLRPSHLTPGHQNLSRSPLAPRLSRLHLDRHHPHIYRSHHYLCPHPRMQSRPQRQRRTKSESGINWWQKEGPWRKIVDAKLPSMTRISRNWMRSCNRGHMPLVFSVSLSRPESEHLCSVIRLSLAS